TLLYGGRRSLLGEAAAPEMKHRTGQTHDDDAKRECGKRQISNIDRYEPEKDRCLHRVAQRVARLRQDCGIAGNRTYDSRSSDVFNCQKLGMPYLIDELHAQ